MNRCRLRSWRHCSEAACCLAETSSEKNINKKKSRNKRSGRGSLYVFNLSRAVIRSQRSDRSNPGRPESGEKRPRAEPSVCTTTRVCACHSEVHVSVSPVPAVFALRASSFDVIQLTGSLRANLLTQPEQVGNVPQTRARFHRKWPVLGLQLSMAETQSYRTLLSGFLRCVTAVPLGRRWRGWRGAGGGGRSRPHR